MRTLSIGLISFLALTAVMGCAKPQPAPTKTSKSGADHDHDHGHRPESYTAAIAELIQHQAAVKTAFDAKTPDKCDDALHEVAELLRILPEVAADTDMSKEDWQVVKTTAEDLFQQFEKIHEGFHGEGQGSSYDEVSVKIESGVKILQSKLAAAKELESVP